MTASSVVSSSEAIAASGSMSGPNSTVWVAAWRATALVFSNARTRRPAAYARARSTSSSDGPSEEEVERARAYAAGRRVLAFENTNAVARHAATQTVVHGQEVDPDAAIALLDETTIEQVRDVAAGMSDRLSVACVGPHTVEDFA